MKRLISLLFTVVFLTLLSVNLIAGDTYDQTAVCYEDDKVVVFSGTVTFTGDGTGNWYTQALYIPDCRYYHAYFTGWTNAESGDDVNIFVEYSNDRSIWKLSSQASGQIIDDLNGGTVQADTIDVVAATQDCVFKGAVWMRLKLDGQTGNPVTTEVTWIVTLTKTESGFGRIRHSGRVKDKI